MNRGEVWWVNFDPAVGGEIRKHLGQVSREELDKIERAIAVQLGLPLS